MEKKCLMFNVVFKKKSKKTLFMTCDKLWIWKYEKMRIFLCYNVKRLKFRIFHHRYYTARNGTDGNIKKYMFLYI